MSFLPNGITHFHFESTLKKTQKVTKLLQEGKINISKYGYLSPKKLRKWLDKHPQYKRNYIDSL